jgi:hypothetical protein
MSGHYMVGHLYNTRRLLVWLYFTKCADEIDDTKGSFHGELDHVFDPFSTYHMKILLGILVQK